MRRALILRENYTDHSVVDRVTGRYPNISSFKGLRRLGNLTISHSVPCATVRYTSRAGISGHKLATWRNGLITRRLFKLLMGLRFLVGARGFEPPTSRSRTERSTRLSHAPTFPKGIHFAPQINLTPKCTWIIGKQVEGVKPFNRVSV
jgi:hypothetical protein